MHHFKNYPFIKEDENAKSLSFFNTGNEKIINNSMIEELKSIVSEEVFQARISLHDSPSELLHDMVVAQNRKLYVRPHKHPKTETYHIVDGKTNLIIFDDIGNIKSTHILSKDYNSIFRLEKDQFHTMLHFSDVVVFHEIKNGPYMKESDNVFSSWAPDGKNNDEVVKYLEKLFGQTL